jgi:predicted enzyme related to lactoylglutathione lyase
MLADAKIMAVIPVRDLGRARTFYEKMLGLSPQAGGDAEDGLVYSLNNTGLLVYETEAPRGEATKAVFAVGDLATEMGDLRSHGVVFEDFDLPDLKTVNGVFEGPQGRTAWFKDLDGNYLGIMEPNQAT